MKRKSPSESSDSGYDSSKKSKPNEPTTTTTIDSKKGPNEKKLFWAVDMASLKFVNQGADADMLYLLDATERLGEGTVQYCCLGLFVDTDTEKDVYVLNKRYKNAIAVSKKVKGVTLFEMIYENDVVTKIETHDCKPSSKNYYSATSDLAHAGAITSRLAWKIQYENSFDLHVMKAQSTRIVRSQGSLEEFKEYQKDLVKYDPKNLTKSKRPMRASSDLDPNSPITTPQDDFQNALQVILRANQEQKQYAINAIQNSLPFPQLNPMEISNIFNCMMIYNNFAHQQTMFANQQSFQQPEIQNIDPFMLNSTDNEDFLQQLRDNRMPIPTSQYSTKQVYQENDQVQKYVEMQNEKQIPWTEGDIFYNI